MDFDDIKYVIDNDETNYDSNHYYYYANTILNTFQQLNKTISLNFHNSCKKMQLSISFLIILNLLISNFDINIW